MREGLGDIHGPLLERRTCRSPGHVTGLDDDVLQMASQIRFKDGHGSDSGKAYSRESRPFRERSKNIPWMPHANASRQHVDLHRLM